MTPIASALGTTTPLPLPTEMWCTGRDVAGDGTTGALGGRSGCRRVALPRLRHRGVVFRPGTQRARAGWRDRRGTARSSGRGQRRAASCSNPTPAGAVQGDTTGWSWAWTRDGSSSTGAADREPSRDPGGERWARVPRRARTSGRLNQRATGGLATRARRTGAFLGPEPPDIPSRPGLGGRDPGPPAGAHRGDSIWCWSWCVQALEMTDLPASPRRGVDRARSSTMPGCCPTPGPLIFVDPARDNHLRWRPSAVERPNGEVPGWCYWLRARSGAGEPCGGRSITVENSTALFVRRDRSGHLHGHGGRLDPDRLGALADGGSCACSLRSRSVTSRRGLRHGVPQGLLGTTWPAG